MGPDARLIRVGWACVCPRCEKGALYRPGVTLSLRSACPACGLDYSKNDSADGPAVFLIFILGFALVPLALAVDWALAPPLWVHAVLWSVLTLGLTLGALRPLKAYIIALQFKHCPQDWD
jgi:uncharacterized protein (DUF983 family)